MPRLDVQLRRDKRRNRRPVPEPDTGDITPEEVIFPVVNMMMTGMARCGDCADFERGHVDDLLVFQNSDALFRDGCDSAPQPLHVAAEDSGRGPHQFRGVDEVPSPTGMDVNSRTKFGESPGCAGVIAMNVTEKNVPDVVRRDANLPKRGHDIVKN